MRYWVLVWCLTGCAPPQVVYVYVPAPRVSNSAALLHLYDQERAAREAAQTSDLAPTPERCRLLLAAVPDDARGFLTAEENGCRDH